MNNILYYQRFKIVLYLFLSIFVFYRCENIASTKEITDPKEIRPIITIKSSMDNITGNSKQTIEVIIKDINNDAIIIDGGNVYVNGIQMRLPQNDLFGAKDESYELISEIIPDSLYIFEIVFSDGTTYMAWIETPEIDFFQLDVPEQYPRNTDLVVKWLDVDFRYPQYCVIQYYDAVDGFSENNQVRFIVHSPYDGEYTIKSKYIKYYNKSNARDAEIRVKVIAETTGEVSDEFLTGGSVKCQMAIYQDIEIY